MKFHKSAKYSSSSGNATNFKYVLFKKLLKFLLSKDEVQSSAISKVKSEEPEEIEVKEETVEAEVKSIKPKKRTVKDEIIDVEVDTDNK